MKKFFFTIAALVLGLTQMSAQKLIFGDVEVPKGGEKTYTVKYETGGETLTTASFNLSLPEGVSTEKNSAGKSKFVVDSKMSETFSSFTTESDGFSVAATTTGVSFPGPDGDLGTLTLIADAESDLVIGNTYPVTVSKISLVKRNKETGALESVEFKDVTFNIKIVENRVTLDETVGVTSETPTGEQNVLVKRTIKAGNWNTICLPFAMTADQVKAAFGEGVQLADFNGCDSDGDKDHPSTSIKVKFNAVDAIEANHPYLIKVESALTEFRADAVTISPDEEKAIIQMDKSSGRNPVYNSFVGTYNPSTIIPVGGLFLNSNKFYYSNGNSKLKAFRAYFDFAVSYLEEAPYESKIWISIDGDATSIDGIGTQRVVEGVYDLSGRKIQLEDGDLNKLQKGVYIIDGKKVTIK